MTVVVEKRPNGTYRIRVKRKDADGKWRVVKEVAGFTSEKEARGEAKKARELLRKGKLGTSTVTPTVETLLDAYQKKLEARGAPGAYHVTLARPHLQPLLDVEVGQLTFDRVQDRVDELVAKRVGPWAIKRAFAILRTAIEPARRGNNPVDGVKVPKPPKRKGKVRVYTPDEARALLPHMNPGFRDFFHLDLLTGARPSELAAVGCDDIDLGAAQWRVCRSLTRQMTKDRDDRVIPLSREAVGIFKRLIAEARERGPEVSDIYDEVWVPVFPSLVRNQARNANLAIIVQRAARAAVDAGDAPTLALGWDLKCRWCKHVERVAKKPKGDVRCSQCDRLAWPVPVTQRVIWYSLRHTTVTLLDDAGVSTKVISEVVGHSSTAFTEATYIHRAQETMRAAMSKVSLKPKKGG